MDAHVMADTISGWIAARVAEAGAGGVIVGLSGGIDSSVVARLAGSAVSVHGVILPCGSDPQDALDARAVEHDCHALYEVDLTAVHGVMAQVVTAELGEPEHPEDTTLPLANLKSRLRMAMLYFLANRDNLLVCGTTNKTEWLTGYYTKYGDGGVDIEPIVDAWKTDVRRMAAHLEIPQAIIDKPPTAGLWQGQTDEAELGMTYAELDKYLADLHQALIGGDDLIYIGGTYPTTETRRSFNKVKELYRKSQHKRALPPCCILVEDK